MKYRALDLDKTVETISALHDRISERFPSSGLSEVCNELCAIARESKVKLDEITKANIYLRVFVYSVIFISLLLLGYSISLVEIQLSSLNISDMAQIAESVVNDIVFIGIAFFFLVTVEVRIKRVRVLQSLHELRAISHVIDMHQLTKDPSKILKTATSTASSPKKTLTIFELIRYLDYCSEMLALTSKLSALYAQKFNDGVVLAAVNELETLTTGLSRKIWQKIVILHKLEKSA